MGTVIGFLTGVAASAAVFALAVRRMHRRRADLTDVGRIFARARGRHLRRVKMLTPVAAGVELARRSQSPTVALTAATLAAAAVVVPANDRRPWTDTEAYATPADPTPSPTQPAGTDGPSHEPEPVGLAHMPEPSVRPEPERPSRPNPTKPEPEPVDPEPVVELGTDTETAAETGVRAELPAADVEAAVGVAAEATVSATLDDPEPAESETLSEPKPPKSGCIVDLTVGVTDQQLLGVCV